MCNYAVGRFRVDLKQGVVQKGAILLLSANPIEERPARNREKLVSDALEIKYPEGYFRFFDIP